MPDAPKTPFRLLDWDSAHFGMKIGRVLPTRGDKQLFHDASIWAAQESLDCMYLLADSDHPSTIRLAHEYGWRMVDMRVTLSAASPAVKPDRSPVRLATPTDLPYLKELARCSHKDSRFYADGNFPPSACDDLFALWIERSVRDRAFAGAVFVPELEAGQPAGYITCAIRQGVGEIGLIAVDPKMHRKGFGTSLLAEAARWFAGQGAQRMSVVTQGSNIPALRMYERFGFTIESIQLWFHWWRNCS